MGTNSPPAGWYPRRGEVYLVQLDKPRPAIVLSIDQLNRHALDVCVVGITSKEHLKFSMRIAPKAKEGGLDLESWATCDQVTTLEKRLLRYPALGALPAPTIARIEQQVKIALGLP
jgi:mRNA-degrading endonuclease toxin of MazEF toxin-antitoxin module